MPLNARAKELKTSDPVVLVAFRGVNTVKQKYQPMVSRMVLTNIATEKQYKFRTTLKDSRNKETSSRKYIPELEILSAQLPPGDYRLDRLVGTGIINKGWQTGAPQGQWKLDINKTFTLKPQQTLYLGRIEATVVKKGEDNEDEKSASKVYAPLLDGAIANVIAGFIGSYFQIDIANHMDEDLAHLKSIYPWFKTDDITQAELNNR